MLDKPTYTDEKRKGNIGEAFVQYVLSSFCLVHKIDGSQDLGNDFICELMKGKYPTNILFYVQVKYWKDKPQDSQIKKTIKYWKDSSIPVYLFWVEDKKDEFLELTKDMLRSDSKNPYLQYKRYTPIVHGNKQEKMKKFIKFSINSFLENLMIDYVRCLYKRGMTTVIEKNAFKNINGVKSYLYVGDIIPQEYGKEIIENSWTNLLAAASSLLLEVSKHKSLLEVSKHKSKLKLALKNIELAKDMFNASKKAKIRYSGFDKVINDIEKKIKQKLINFK